MVSAALIASLSGCSVFNTLFGKDDDKTTVSGAEASEVKKGRQKIAEEIVAQTPNEAPSREIPPIRIQPSPMQAAEQDSTVEMTKPQPKVTELSKTARLVGGSWTIVQVGDKKIDRDDDMPYIVFVPGDGSFYANNGCNTLNGSYSVEGEKIAFHNVLTTMRLCPDVDFDHEINAIICDEVATNIRISESGNETILEFVTPSGSPLMRLRRGNLEFLNGQWDVTGVDGLPSMKSPATVFFDLTDMKLHGNTGCNFINGEIYLDHRIPNAIDFSQIITTLMACQYPEQQTCILVALEQTASAVSDGADKVMLLDGDGKILMELKRSKQ